MLNARKAINLANLLITPEKKALTKICSSTSVISLNFSLFTSLRLPEDLEKTIGKIGAIEKTVTAQSLKALFQPLESIQLIPR